MLQNIPLFSGLSEAELNELESHTFTKAFPRGRTIINDGDISDSVYCIMAGKVKVYLCDENGKEILLSTQGPGEYFGEMALLDHAPRSANVVTIEKTTLSIITRDDFFSMVTKSPDISINIIRNLIKRMRELTDNVKSLALMDVYGRVARTLISLANDVNGTLIINQKLTHQDIADRVGSSREMVTRIMKELKMGGFVHIEGQRTVLRDRLPERW